MFSCSRPLRHFDDLAGNPFGTATLTTDPQLLPTSLATTLIWQTLHEKHFVAPRSAAMFASHSVCWLVRVSTICDRMCIIVSVKCSSVISEHFIWGNPVCRGWLAWRSEGVLLPFLVQLTLAFFFYITKLQTPPVTRWSTQGLWLRVVQCFHFHVHDSPETSLQSQSGIQTLFPWSVQLMLMSSETLLTTSVPIGPLLC